MTTTALVYRMVIAAMAKDRQALYGLYEKYIKARHLHVSILEHLEAKRETA